MKKKLLAFIFIVILIIPSVVAVVNYNKVKNSPISSKSVREMQLIDLDKVEYKFEKSTNPLNMDNISDNMIEFFLDLNSKATSVSDLPDPLKGTEYFKVTFLSYGRKVNYKYYFTEKTEASYYIDDNNNCYQISSDYAEKFLLSLYGKSLFPASKMPVLTISTGDVITPSSLTWTYPTVGENKNTIPITNNAVNENLTLSGNIDLGFDIIPDSVNIIINQNGEEIFNGLYEEIGLAQIAVNSQVSVTVNAKWYENEARPSGGEATYTFSGTYVDKPVFYLSKTKVNPGDFVVLTGKNITDISSISFTSEPSINYTPVFFQDGVYVRALIPISIYLDYSESYLFTVTAGGESQNITLVVENKQFITRSTDISAAIVNKTRTEASLAEFKTSMASIYSKQTPEKYWDGIFIDPVPSKTVRVGFGIHHTITATGETYRYEGVGYASKVGDNVFAVNNGVVIYTGEQTLSGKLVVIDHGFGLKSTYWNMNSISVNVGDSVKTGDVIGTVGNTGFTDGKSMKFVLTVFDVPVCVYPLWDEGVLMIG